MTLFSEQFEDIKNSIVEFNVLVFCVLLTLSSPWRSVINYVINYVIIILVHNTAFDTANAGKGNVAFVFVIEEREWFVVSASSLQVVLWGILFL